LRTVTNRFSSGETAKYLSLCKIVPRRKPWENRLSRRVICGLDKLHHSDFGRETEFGL
jgi:hypothetical protein